MEYGPQNNNASAGFAAAGFPACLAGWKTLVWVYVCPFKK